MKIADFLIANTSHLWAEIYQKRNRADKNIMDWYDPAAQINQHHTSLADQDNVIKEIFRQLVDYISSVCKKFFFSELKSAQFYVKMFTQNYVLRPLKKMIRSFYEIS